MTDAVPAASDTGGIFVPIINIADDFTRTPGGRRIRTGPASGEEFREKLLAPKLRIAVEKGVPLVVVLDGVAGYPVSFLEEAFGGLIRYDGFSKEALLSGSLKIEAQTGRFKTYSDLAYDFIRDATPQ